MGGATTTAAMCAYCRTYALLCRSHMRELAFSDDPADVDSFREWERMMLDATALRGRLIGTYVAERRARQVRKAA